jgi:hypothetical protein
VVQSKGYGTMMMFILGVLFTYLATGLFIDHAFEDEALIGKSPFGIRLMTIALWPSFIHFLAKDNLN